MLYIIYMCFKTILKAFCFILIFILFCYFNLYYQLSYNYSNPNFVITTTVIIRSSNLTCIMIIIIYNSARQTIPMATPNKSYEIVQFVIIMLFYLW